MILSIQEFFKKTPIWTLWEAFMALNIRNKLFFVTALLVFIIVPLAIKNRQTIYQYAAEYSVLEPELGSISGAIVVGNDINASGGKYVQFGSTEVTGTSYYVDCNNGSDSNNGTSESTAWKTLNKATSAILNAGDGLLLKRGCIWLGTLSVSRVGTATNNIIIGAYGTGELPIIQNNTTNTQGIDITGSYITVENVYVQGVAPSIETGCRNNPKGWIVGFRLRPSSHHVIVKNSKATGNYAGAYIELGSNNNQISNNIFQNNNMMYPLDTTTNNDAGAFGVLIHGNNNEIAYNTFSGQAACTYDYGTHDGSDVEIFRGQINNIHHNISTNSNGFSELGGDATTKTADNIYAYNKVSSDLIDGYFLTVRGGNVSYGPTYRTKAYNNTVYLTGSSSQGVVCHAGCSNDILTLKNNILWANWKAAYADAPFNESNNIYWKTGGSPLVQGFTPSLTSKKVDPLFVLTGTDFHLSASSPAIDFGTTESINAGYITDLDKMKVPAGTAPDIGAYEYGSRLVIKKPKGQVAAANSFTFGAVGDHGAGSNGSAVFKAIGGTNPSFFLSLGDLSYGDKTPESSWCQWVKDNINVGAGKALGDSFGNNYPVEIIVGGHENGVDNPTDGLIENFVASDCLPNRLTVTQSPNLGINPSSIGNYAKEYYFDYPQTNPIARFLLLTPHLKMLYGYDASCGTSTNCLDYRKGSPRYNWASNVIDDARAKGIKWIIVANHENYISTGIKGNEIGPDYFNLLLEKKVDLILQGHEHNYERGKQLAFNGSTCTVISPSASTNTACVVDDGADGQYTKGSGTVLLINGMGGVGAYALSSTDPQAGYFAVSQNTVFGFSKFNVSDTQITAEFVKGQGLPGTFTDSFTISEASSVMPTPSPSATPVLSPIASPTLIPTPTPTSCIQMPTNNGLVSSTINLSEAGTYSIWSRIAGYGSNDSYFLQIDDGCPVIVGDIPSTTTNWQWVDYKNGSTATKIIANLTSGSHTIKMVGRESGVKLDRLILTTNPLCLPTDKGDNCLTTSVPTSTPMPTLINTPTPTNVPTVTPTIPVATPTPTPIQASLTPTLVPSVNGLQGMYYSNRNLSGTPLSRIDPNINFNWGKSSPMSGISSNNFSVRWTGYVIPQYSENYTFYASADDGVRVWVNNAQIINAWSDHSVTEYNSNPIYLNANQKYLITVEYYERSVYASAKMSWSSASTPKAIIPQSQLTYK